MIAENSLKSVDVFASETSFIDEQYQENPNYKRGYEPLETLPASWYNSLMKIVTEQCQAIKQVGDSMYAELKSLIEGAGGILDTTRADQVLAAVKKLAEIPIATGTEIGGVFSSAAPNKVLVNSDGTLTPNALKDWEREDTVGSLVPSQATPSNQLADKDFVNSSIATNTSYYIGTYDSLDALKSQTDYPVTNNDYAFVTRTDSAGNVLYDRYKYNGEEKEWLFEYSLNNSGFTAEQLAAINSGITAAKVAGMVNMRGASSGAAGAAGYVPAPNAGQQGAFLRGDGAWATVSTTAAIFINPASILANWEGIFVVNGPTVTAPANGFLCVHALVGGSNTSLYLYINDVVVAQGHVWLAGGYIRDLSLTFYGFIKAGDRVRASGADANAVAASFCKLFGLRS